MTDRQSDYHLLDFQLIDRLCVARFGLVRFGLFLKCEPYFDSTCLLDLDLGRVVLVLGGLALKL